MSLMNSHPAGPSVAPCPIPNTATMNMCQLVYSALPNAVVITYFRLYSIVARKKQHEYGKPALRYARRRTR
eukprot:15358873-Ditylum_brightwellii.AAC.1